MEFDEQVALVTGAGSGIGRASALQLARQGARVACLGRTKSELEEVVSEIKSDGGSGLVTIADVAKPDQMQAAIEKTASEWGRLDLIVANAGVNGVWASLEELEPDDWDQTLEINLKGTFLTVKYALPYLKKRGGSIVVVASVNGTRMFSNTGATAYACSKAGQLAFTKMVAVELAPHKIRINCICPGWIDTKIGDNTEQRNLEKIRHPVEFPEGSIPLTGGAPGTSEQTAQLITFLLSNAAAHITGTEMWIDGGQSLVKG